MSSLLNFSFRDLPPRLMGAATFVVATVAMVGAFLVASTDIFSDNYEVTVVFEETGGLRGGDPVRVAGIDVGRVSSITPDFEQGFVVVTAKIDSGVELGAETTAEVALSTLLGGRYVRLAGPVEAPYLEDLPAAERQIPLERTRLPLGVIDALGQLTTTAEQLDAEQVDRLLREAAALAQDNAGPTADIFADVVVLGQAVNERRETIERLIDDTVQVTDALAARDQMIARLIDASEGLLGEIAARESQLRTVLGSGSAATATLADLVERNRVELDAILSDLDVTVDVVRGRLPELHEAFATAGPTVQALADITKTGNWADVVLTGLSAIQLRNAFLEVAG